MWKLGLGLFSLLACVCFSSVEAGTTTQEPTTDCTPRGYCPEGPDCALPNCRCSGDDPTYNNDYDKTLYPQILYLTYDDAFTGIAESQFYRGLFNGTFKNPDDSAIRATHFLTGSYTDYKLVNKYWRELGHEMASHSVTHKTDQNYWKGINSEGWMKEALGMRKMITQFANIPADNIEGFRAPYLQMGGDEMYKGLSENGFKYDCSWVSRDFGYQHLDNGLFPYTMDFDSIQDCEVGPCPTCSFPGFWVQPMLDLEDNWFGSNPLHPDWGQPCSMLDGCIFIEEQTAEAARDMLLRNFNKSYNGNRAPFGLYMHAAWFFGDVTWHYEGYKMFLEEVGKLDDVWIVPISEGIDYYANFANTTNAELLAMGDQSPFALAPKKIERESFVCDELEPCSYQVENEDIHKEERYMTICGRVGGRRQACPKEYPWLTNPCGGNGPCL